MKTKLLFLALIAAATGMQAQTTHMVDWFFGVPTSETNVTIEPGDSVMWMWTDSMPHTVTSLPSADEAFESGTLTGSGQTFTHLFPNEGVSDYICIFHGNMVGQITVQATMAVDKHQKRTFSVYPNPVSDILNVQSAGNQIDRITVFDSTGKQMIDTSIATPEAKIYMSNYPSGVYLVKVESQGKSETISVVRN